MKIARIKKIKNVGSFSNFENGGQLGFEKLTFIYGLNSYGKTTLTDVFQSLKTNDSTIIQNRKTIPLNDDGQQEIVLSIKDQKEKNVEFTNGEWSENNVSDHLEVFGPDFIHKNIFTGLTIERSNRENLTQFIIGDAGVVMAKDIADKKEKLGREKRDLKKIVPAYVKDEADDKIASFLNLSIKDLEKSEIENELVQKKVDLKKEQKYLKEPQKILQLSEPDKFTPAVFNVLEVAQQINDLLQEDYSNIKNDALSCFRAHINENFSNQVNAEVWIKTGLSHCKDISHGNCPFCGQALENAYALIETYNAYFDLAYKNFINRIEGDLREKIRQIEDVSFSQKMSLLTIISKLTEYREIMGDEEFNVELKKFKERVEALDEEKLINKKNDILKIVKASCELKNKCPHKRIDVVDFSIFEKELTLYNESLDDSTLLFNNLLSKIKIFKDQYKDANTINNSIVLLQQSIQDLEYKKARIDQDRDCNIYKKSQQNIRQLETEISVQTNELQVNQSQYLKDYFNKIDKLFKKFGSRNFMLESESDTSGHQPVYSLKVKFREQRIENKQLSSVFSESDRRALAFAVFWARIELKKQGDREKAIIVLDDPIVSFDDNRITNTITLLKKSADKVDQIIILTHYPQFIKRFCELARDVHVATKFLEIKQDNLTSALISSNKDNYVTSDYEKVFLKIYGFINRAHDDCDWIKSNLRKFLENLYLPTVFAKQIQDKKIDCERGLEKMIDEIFNDHHETVKERFHEFRKTSNPEHHIFTSTNVEDIRNFTSEMMEYLFSLNFHGITANE